MAMPTASSLSDLRVKAGDTVILDVNGEKQLFLTVRPTSKVKLGGSQVSAEPIIGCLYGSLFTLTTSSDGECLVKKQHTPATDWDAPVDVTKNNANLMDAGTANQQLSAEDIAAMKAAGKSGDEIVAALAASSATFDTKSEFSQEKYKKKKAKKYIFNVVVRRPTAATICQAYYSKHPAKIGFLRLDALSLLLSLANVGSGARVLVLETCGGLITGAVAERLGGYGSVTAAFVGGRPPGSEALQQFNLGKEGRAVVRTASLAQLLAQAAAAAAGDESAGQDGEEGGRSHKQQRAERGEAMGAAAAVPNAEAGSEPTGLQEAGQGEAMQAEALAQNGEAAGAGGGEGGQAAEVAVPTPWQPFSSCIIAAPALSPCATLLHVLPLLAPSASFAVHCQWAQPLAEAMSELQGVRRAVGMTLQESWWREHQVLPSRTHPTMNMNHGGGYLLSGTVVAAEGQGEGQAGRKRKA